jgi:hypothetical protein
LGITIPYENFVLVETNSRLTLGSACYHSVQNLLSSHLISKIFIKTKKSMILPDVFYVCEICSITLREEYSFRVSENRVRKRIFGPKREEVAGGWRRFRSEKLYNLYASLTIVKGKSKGKGKVVPVF